MGINSVITIQIFMIDHQTNNIIDRQFIAISLQKQVLDLINFHH